MTINKERAFELRKTGKTYREIKKSLGISLSTLSGWFKDEKWSEDISKNNKEIQIKNSVIRLKILNEKRRLMLKKKYLEIEEQAKREFEINKNNPLFMAGLMLYAGEGDKSSKHLVRLSNSEFYLHSVFIRFSGEFLGVKRKNIKFWLLLYPDHSTEECLNIWSRKTGIGRQNFNKSQIIKGKSKTKKLQYGVGNSIISSTGLKKKMMKWLDLCKRDFG